ncbi:MAG TPA: DUF177 domain-containing protein [Bacillota bacterium]|nr:DUF177 domain-containing protein [Bacillota bacterium]
MIILLNELEKAPHQTLSLDNQIDMSTVRYQDVAAFEDFYFKGQVSKEAVLVVTEGIITGLLKVKCSKCLVPTEYPLEIDFNEQFAEGPVDEEGDIHSFHGGKIDLTPYFHESIFLELPQVFNCGEDCKGLCPTCGVNRNVEPCGCVNERIDPRLADLALFFEKDQK